MLEASINYIAPMDEKPTYYMEPPAGVPEENMTYEGRTVAIRDARELSPPASLDREGFELATHHTAVANLYEVEAIRAPRESIEVRTLAFF